MSQTTVTGSTDHPAAAPAKRRPQTPAAVLLRCFLLLSVLWFTVPWLAGVVFQQVRAVPSKPSFVERAQLRAIRLGLASGQVEKMGRFFYEGRFFSYTFYGFALVNMAVADPQDTALRAHAVQELERIIPIAERMTGERPFHRNLHLVPRGGIIPAGQTNLLRAGYVILGGQRQDILAAYHASSQELYDAFTNSPVANLESYAGMIWPVDNCCALQSLYLHDRRYGTSYAEACRRWEQWMAGRLDPASGMMIAQINATGGTEDGPRGCALSWSLAFMSNFAPDLARSQYDRYRRDWLIHTLDMTGMREWAPGREGHMDPDTGPVIGGVGLAATGFGIAAATAQNDVENLQGILLGMEALGCPLWTSAGKHYVFGQFILPDAIALWGRTICDWSNPVPATGQAWPAVAHNNAWIVLAAGILLTAGLIVLSLRSVRIAWVGLKTDPNAWRQPHRAVFYLDLLVIAGWLLVPAVTWLMAIIVIGLLEIVDRRILCRWDAIS